MANSSLLPGTAHHRPGRQRLNPGFHGVGQRGEKPAAGHFFKARPAGTATLHSLALNPGALRQTPVGETLQVPLPSGEMENYTLRRRQEFDNGDITLEAMPPG